MKLRKVIKILSFTAIFLVAGFLFVPKAQAVMSFGFVSLDTQSFVQGSRSTITMSGTFRAGFSSHACRPNIDQEPQDYHANWVMDISYEIMGTSTGRALNEGSDWFLEREGVSSSCNSTGAVPEAYYFTNISIPVGSLPPGDYQIRLYGNEWMEHGTPFTTDELAVAGPVGFSQAPSVLNFTVLPVASGTVEVYSNQATCWTVSGPASRASCGSTFPFTYDSMPLGTYSATADDLSCFNKTLAYDPTNRTLTDGGLLKIYITYNPTCGNPPPPPPEGPPPPPPPPPPPGCAYTIDPTSQSFGASGGTGTIQVSTTQDCPWNAVSNNTFITITSGSAGNESGAVGYSVSANSGSGRTGTISVAGHTFTVNQGGTSGPCSDDSSVVVVKGLKNTYAPGETDTFRVQIHNTGSTWWYHGSAYKWAQLTSMSISPTYGHISPSLPSGNSWDYRDFTFNFTAPTTPGNYNLRMQMLHVIFWDYQYNDGTICAPGASADTYFGQQFSDSFNVEEPGSGPLVAFTIVYTPRPANAPVVTVDNSVCARITVNWTFNANGVEDGFNVYRSIDNANWVKINPSLLPISARSYQDTPPAFNVRYYYMVRSHKSVPNDSESPNSNSADAVNQPCAANLNPTSMALTQVNGAAYTSSTQIKNGDQLTYEIVIRNVGTDDADMQRICVNPTSNLTNPTQLTVSGPGAVNGGISTNNAQCTSDGNSGLRFSVTGTKDRTNHWYISYRTTYTASSPNATQETIGNCARIYFADDQGSHSLTRCAGTTIVDTSKPKIPTFREVAP